MNIGMPRALLHYYYYPFWKRLFEELGCRVVLSDITNTILITDGIKVTVSELCVPIKIFNGHILNLMQKDVDLIFVPRFISMGSEEWYCPKFIGLPDLVRFSIDGLEQKLLILDITSKGDILNRFSDYKPLINRLGVSKSQTKSALRLAKEEFDRFRRLCISGYTIDEAICILEGKEVELPKVNADVTIALMGYVYNIYDNFVSMNILGKLRDMGVRVITFDMLDEEELLGKKSKEKGVYWVFSRKILEATKMLLKNPKVDGVIHMTAFSCGPDSVLGKLMELDSEELDKSFMTIRIDEHTGESHVQTRIEAFVDMLRMSKEKIKI